MWAWGVGALALRSACGEVFFSETFDEHWEERWDRSSVYSSPGEFQRSAGTWSLDGDDYKGIRASSEEGGTYAYSSSQFKPFSNRNKTLIIQFQLKRDPEKHLDDISSFRALRPECSGGYVQLGPKPEDPFQFGDETDYYIRFGPDHCEKEGKMERHFTACSFSYKGKNVEKQSKFPYWQDIWQGTQDQKATQDGGLRISHLYKLTLKPNGQVLVDFDEKRQFKGLLHKSWKMSDSNPAKIADPTDFKPQDWVDEREIPNPYAEKPDWWDSIKWIRKKRAEKPDDWDEVEDGEWSAPMVENPRYAGVWEPPMAFNPEFKGVWRPRQIANPRYVHQNDVYVQPDIGQVGILWYETGPGLIIDNIIITDDKAEAKKFADKWRKLRKYEDRRKYLDSLPEEDRDLELFEEGSEL